MSDLAKRMEKTTTAMTRKPTRNSRRRSNHCTEKARSPAARAQRAQREPHRDDARQQQRASQPAQSQRLRVESALSSRRTEARRTPGRSRTAHPPPAPWSLQTARGEARRSGLRSCRHAAGPRLSGVLLNVHWKPEEDGAREGVAEPATHRCVMTHAHAHAQLRVGTHSPALAASGGDTRARTK